MSSVRNVSHSDLDVPALRRVVGDDEVVEVPDDLFDSLVCQVGVWKAVDTPAGWREVHEDYLPQHERDARVARAEAAELKGPDLDSALTNAGLPTDGKADEKRSRLADHLAASAAPDAQTEV